MRKGYDADIITLSCISSVKDTKPEKIRINPYGSTNCIRLEGIISAPSMGAPFWCPMLQSYCFFIIHRMMTGEVFPKFRMIAADVLLIYCQTKEELAPKRRWIWLKPASGIVVLQKKIFSINNIFEGGKFKQYFITLQSETFWNETYPLKNVFTTLKNKNKNISFYHESS